jgi:hypothetical protein
VVTKHCSTKQIAHSLVLVLMVHSAPLHTPQKQVMALLLVSVLEHRVELTPVF